MILTGKAKEDFKNWCIKNNHDKVDIKYNQVKKVEKTFKIFQNVLIIEFFDSVGIYIEVFFYTDKIVNFKSYINKEIVVGDYGFVYFETRKEATEQAIKKANEIYNTK